MWDAGCKEAGCFHVIDRALHTFDHAAARALAEPGCGGPRRKSAPEVFFQHQSTLAALEVCHSHKPAKGKSEGTRFSSKPTFRSHPVMRIISPNSWGGNQNMLA